MKTKYEIALKRSFNQVKRWRKAFYLHEDTVGAKYRFISLIREELTESSSAITRKKALDLYVDVIFYCLSSAIEEGLSFKEIEPWYVGGDSEQMTRKKDSWKALSAELNTELFVLTGRNWSLLDIVSHIIVTTRIIYGDRITDTEFFQAFDMVYRNNMKKFWTLEEYHGQCKHRICIRAIRRGPRNLIVKDSRGKIMKPPGFVEVKL